MMLCEAMLTMRAIVVVLLLSCVEGKNEITIYNETEVATGMSKTQIAGVRRAQRVAAASAGASEAM